MEGEVCFILEASKHGESGCMSKGQPLTPSLGQELLNWSSRGVYTVEGGYMQKQHSHLEVGHERSDQCHLGCFKYRVNVFAFLEAGSQNWGSFWTRFSNGEHKQSHHSYRLVTLSLTSPPGGRFSIYKTAHRIWLGPLSTDTEEELRSLVTD